MKKIFLLLLFISIVGCSSNDTKDSDYYSDDVTNETLRNNLKIVDYNNKALQYQNDLDYIDYRKRKMRRKVYNNNRDCKPPMY